MQWFCSFFLVLFLHNIPLFSLSWSGFSWLPCLARACSCCHSFSSFSVILRFFRYSTQLSQRQYKNKWVSPCYPIVQRFLFKLFLDGFKLKQLILYLCVELQTQKCTEIMGHCTDHRLAIDYKYVFHRLSGYRIQVRLSSLVPSSVYTHIFSIGPLLSK